MMLPSFLFSFVTFVFLYDHDCYYCYYCDYYRPRLSDTSLSHLYLLFLIVYLVLPSFSMLESESQGSTGSSSS